MIHNDENKLFTPEEIEKVLKDNKELLFSLFKDIAQEKISAGEFFRVVELIFAELLAQKTVSWGHKLVVIGALGSATVEILFKSAHEAVEEYKKERTKND